MMKHWTKSISSVAAGALAMSVLASPIALAEEAASSIAVESEAIDSAEAAADSTPTDNNEQDAEDSSSSTAIDTDSSTPTEEVSSSTAANEDTSAEFDESAASTAANSEALTSAEEAADSIVAYANARSGGEEIAGSITVDGDDRDWANIGGITMNAGNSYTVNCWKTAMDKSGNVYLCITGTANMYCIGNLQYDGIQIVQNGSYNWHSFYDLWKDTSVTHAIASDVGSNYGPYVLEMCLPASMFQSSDFQLVYQNLTLLSSSIPVLDGSAAPEPEEPVYSGITIDGDFSDWDAVTKIDGPGCTNEGHPNCVESCAMVFDGDEVYIYLREVPGYNAGSAGSHGNGNYAITTDLGRTLLIDLEADGTVANIEGAKCVHNGTQWEISISRSALPPYNKSLNFGFYQGDPVINGVENLDGSSGNAGTFSGIVYDGQYDDWTSYPHTLIQYATAGTQGRVPDGESAIYAEGSTLYGHTVTEYSSHLVGGRDLADAITIAFNGDHDFKDTPEKGNLYPCLVAVDEAGNINYTPNISGLPNGSYEFYIMDTRSWHYSKNINDLQGNDRIFGKMTITIQDGREECEYMIDLEEVAAYIGCDASDFKLIEAQFGRIGQQWTSTAGASSGPILGIVLCLASVGVVLFVRKRRPANA